MNVFPKAGHSFPVDVQAIRILQVLAGIAFAHVLSAEPVLPLNAPLASAEAIGPTIVSIAWPPFGNAPIEYRVYRGESPVGVVADLRSLSFVDTALQPATQYSYTILAVNADKSTTALHASAKTLPDGPVRYRTTFEVDTPSPSALIGGWTKLALFPSDISVTTERSRAGKQSLKFDFPLEHWDATEYRDHYGKRAEVGQWTKPLVTRFDVGAEAWVGISEYVDDSWVADTGKNGESLWQFHGGSNGPAGGPPPLALYVNGDDAKVIVNADAIKCYPDANGRTGPRAKPLATFPLSSIRGRWVDWVVHVKFHYTDGLVQVWRDGTKVVDYTGSTIYRSCNQLGDTGDRAPYFKFGIYKWYWGSGGTPTVVKRRVLYADEIRIAPRGGTCDDVRPEGSPPCDGPLPPAAADADSRSHKLGE